MEEEDRDGCSEAKETLKKQTIKAREREGGRKKERQTQRQRGMMGGLENRAEQSPGTQCGSGRRKHCFQSIASIKPKLTSPQGLVAAVLTFTAKHSRTSAILQQLPLGHDPRAVTL